MEKNRKINNRRGEWGMGDGGGGSDYSGLESTYIVIMILIQFAFACFNSKFWLGQKCHYFWSWYDLIDDKKKDILILGKGPTEGLDHISLTAEAQYSISFPNSNRKFCLRLHYNERNRFLFAKATKIYQFKVKDSEIKSIILRLFIYGKIKRMCLKL